VGSWVAARPGAGAVAERGRAAILRGERQTGSHPATLDPMPTTFLTRAVRFSAAHRYHRPEWSDEKNRSTFGACSNPHGHGHNYRLEATVAGEPEPLTGFCVDLAELDRVLAEEVVQPLDHQHLNHALPEFGPGRDVPTTENLLIYLWSRVAPRIRRARLVRLRLYEDHDLFVDYHGEAAGLPHQGQPTP
jgi:6-pyruvoyltetrahydropterin/6-carboxytetrahydropterin synthase